MEPIDISRQSSPNAQNSIEIYRNIALYGKAMMKYAGFLRIVMILYGCKLILMPLGNLIAEYAFVGELRTRAFPGTETTNPLIWYRLGVDMFSACFPALCCIVGGLFVKAAAETTLATVNAVALNGTRIAAPSGTGASAAPDAAIDSTQC